MDNVCEILSTMENNKSEFVLAGDFNIDLLKINEKYIYSDFLDLLTSFSYFPKITFPTRFTINK